MKIDNSTYITIALMTVLTVSCSKNNIMEKSYKISSSNIKRMVPNLGAAFATDKITVLGKKVDFMVRDNPRDKSDSGWTFYGGGETQQYLDDARNTAIYDVNTIANYDPEIIRFLTYPPGTEVERNKDGRLEIVNKNIVRPEMSFLKPLDEGTTQLSKEWRFYLPSRMLRRVDGGSLVLWKPEFTIWMNTYSSDKTIEERVSIFIENRSNKSTDFRQLKAGPLLKVHYRLIENKDGSDQSSAYIFGFTDTQQINISIYYDSDKYLEEIEKIWESLTASNV